MIGWLTHRVQRYAFPTVRRNTVALMRRCPSGQEARTANPELRALTPEPGQTCVPLLPCFHAVLHRGPCSSNQAKWLPGFARLPPSLSSHPVPRKPSEHFKRACLQCWNMLHFVESTQIGVWKSSVVPCGYLLRLLG